MSLDIRISGKELQWRNSAGTVYSTEAPAVSGSGAKRSIRMTTSNNLEYIDNNGQARRCVLDQDGTVIASVKTRSLYIENNNLVVIGTPAGELDPRPKYIVLDGEPPTETPSSLSITMPFQATFHPWDAKVDWTNTSTEWQVRIKWFRNNNLVQSALRAAGTTSHATDDEYFNSGDSVEVQVSYENAFGNGPVASAFATA